MKFTQISSTTTKNATIFMRFGSLVFFVVSSLVLGVASATFFQFGRVSWREVLSILNSQVALTDVDLNTLLNYGFFWSVWVAIFGATFLAAKKWRSQKRFLIQVALQLFFTILILPNTVTFAMPNGQYQSEPLQTEFGGNESPSSIVHIFVESLGESEEPGLNKDFFERKMLSEHFPKDLAQVEVIEGHGNTILGLLSSWCGVPIDPSSYADPLSDQFSMSGITCIHDYLQQYEFKKYFLAGYTNSFQGKDLYLKEKKVDSFDLDTWRVIDSQNLTSWRGGLNDESLLKNTKSLIQQAELDGKFYVSALTLDNHKPLERPEYCPDSVGDNVFIDHYSCTLNEISRFSEWLLDFSRTSGPILLVIQGDHAIQSESTPVASRDVFFESFCLTDGQIQKSPVPFPENLGGVPQFMIGAAESCGE